MFKSVSKTIVCAGLVLACFADAAPAMTYLPSVRIGTAPLVDPSTADGFYGSTTTATDGLAAITGHATPVAPEIVELARALKNDPDLIYQYVRNNIETEWMYGLAKGPLGSTIDKSGTPFDQAALLVALLKQAGFQASFQSGTVSLTAQQFGQATGLIHGLAGAPGSQTFAVDARAACNFLASGGIPATVEVSTSCSTLTGDLPATGTPVVMAHVWVAVTIPGSTGCASNVCLFDPSMKTHVFKAGFAQSVIALHSGDPLSDATPTSMGSGTISGVPYVNTLDASALATRLSGYATAYLNYLKTTTNLLPNTQITAAGAQIEDAVGGMVLAPVNTPVRQGALPYLGTLQHSWTAIPDQYRTTLEVNADAVMVPFVNPPLPPQPPTDYQLFDTKFFSDEIYGRRLSVATNFNADEMTLQKYYDYIVYLNLDDQPLVTTDIGTVAAVAPDAHSPATFQIQVDHPYAAIAAGDTIAGTYMDARCEGTNTNGKCATGATDNAIYKNAMLATSLSIVAAWGSTGPEMLSKWSSERAQDKALPGPLVGYGGCETCYPTTVNLVGDFTREKVQASFLAQNARALKIHAALAGGREQIHHIVGLVYADDYMDDNGFQAPPGGGKDFKVADTYTRIDVDTGLSLTTGTSDIAAMTSRRAALQAMAATSATIEGSIMAQMEDVPDTGSTATRFEWGNAPTCANGDATKPNGCEDLASASAPQPRNFFQFQPSTTIPTKWALWENHDQDHIPANNDDDGYGNPQHWASGFTGVLTDDIAAYQAKGFQVTASQESFLGPGQRGGYMKPLEPYTAGHDAHQVRSYASVWTKQRGGALVATRYDGNGDPLEIAHVVVGMIVDSSSNTITPVKGGGGGAQPATGATYDPADAGDVLKSKFVDKSNALGVNLANGSLAVDAPVSLKAGSGDFPYALSAGFSWHPGAPSPVPQPNWTNQVGWVPSWNNSLSLSGSGMEALGASDARGAAGAIAAFLAEQDIYKSPPSAQRDVAAVLTQSWWTHQLSANVATVSLGGASRQFVRVADNSWIAPGPGYAQLFQNGTRAPDNYLCPTPLESQDPQYAQSRGWDEHAMSFDVTNPHGDVQHFGYFMFKYNTDSGIDCARQLGFQLQTWSFPQGPIVSLTYAKVQDQETLPPDELPGSTWQLTQVKNNMGQTINLDYGIYGSYLVGYQDGHGREVGVTGTGFTDTLGKLTSFSYLLPQKTSTTQRPVPFGLLSTVTTPEQPALPHTKYDYDSLGRVKQVWDAEALQVGDRVPYQFFLADGTRGARQDPLGGLYSVVYDTYGHPGRYIDELGRETDAVFDGRSRPYTYTFPEGDCEGFTYDDHNNTTAYTRVDKTGACNLTQSGSHRILTQATWDQTWNKPLTIKTPLGNTTTFVYYGLGLAGAGELKTATRPVVAFGAFSVAPVYSFTYDAMGKVQTASVPFAGNANGVTQSIVTRNTYATTTEYLTSSIFDYGGLNITTSFGYDAFGNVTSTTDPRANAGAGGGVTEDLYDSERRKTESHHHDGSIAAVLNAASRTTYDAIGRDTKDESGLTFSGTTVSTWQTDKTTAYTPTSKVASVTDADGSVSLSAYDGLDRTDTVTDPVGRKSHFDYDLAGNQLHEYRGWQSSLVETYATYGYGADNEKLSVADANTNLTNFGYDGFNRLLTTTYPDSTLAHPDVEILAYDKDSNITARTTRAGQAIGYSFDVLDRMTKKTVPAMGSIAAVETDWTYYLNSAVNELDDFLNASTTKNNDLTYGYDSTGRMTSVSTAIPGITGALVTGYQLDLNGNRTQLTWPDGYFVAYAYDSLDRMTTVKESGTSTLATYSYNALSRRTNLAYPNAGMAYSYSPAGDLLTLNHTIAGTGAVPAYTLGYTPAHQLNSEASSQASYTYQPATIATDSYGTPNSLNQYKTINSAPANGHDCQGNAQQYSYDCNGNLTGDGTWAYAYDPENRLITANKTSGGTVSATYAYDPLGRRTHKSGTGVTETYFVDDGTDEIAEYNSTGSAVTRYVPGPAINEPVASVQVSTSAHRYFQTDHHGSVIAMVSQGGNELEGPYTYDAYGNGAPTTGVAYKYVGMRLDPETGLYYDRARYYSPALGRFMQTDPVGYAADMNLYAYSGNDPTDKTDPTGKTTYTCTINQTAGTSNCTISGDDQKPETTVTYHIQRFTKDKNGDVHKTEVTKTVKYPADALGVGTAVRNQVNSYLGVNPSFLDKVIAVLSVGASVVPLQTGGNTINEKTAQTLGFSNRREAGRALEAMKKDNGIANNHQGKIMSNGDYVDVPTGEVLGNVLDYKPGN